MYNQTTSQPSLCLDLKKNRIRIHRNTLQLIDNPDYIQLLVNPTDNMIAIRRSTQRDHLAHKVNLDADDCVELYSAYLIKNLMSVNHDLEYNCSYRLYGNIDSRSETAFFSMDEPILITTQ